MKLTHNAKINSWLLGFAQAMLIVSILFVLCWPVKISGQSMAPTIDSGAWVLCSRLSVWVSEPKPGDIVLFAIDQTLPPMIKRVVALPGDHLQVKDGGLYINGILQQEDYAQGSTNGDCDLVIPEGHFFALGDQRRTSTDSRQYGPVPLKNIKSKVIAHF